MVKVAAKRSTVLSPGELKKRLLAHAGAILPVPLPAPGSFTTREFRSTNPTVLLEALKLRSKSPKPVSAVLLGPDGVPLIGAWSANEIDRTAHAELNLVQAWFAGHPTAAPAGSTLQVSLRPCAMCAAQLLALSGEPGRIRIVFHEEDPGPFSKNSCLVPGSDLWHRAGKPEWEARPYLPSE
jgi:tRNA(Arg) A34 adenosine deaminase TadA